MQETGEIDRAGFQRRQVSLEKGEAPKTVQRDQHLDTQAMYRIILGGGMHVN